MNICKNSYYLKGDENQLSTTQLSSKISHNIIVNMYTKKPKINEDNYKVFKKSETLMFEGIILILIFSACAIFMDYYIADIIKENNFDIGMSNTLYIYGYSLTALFILIGIKLVTMFLFHKIIISEDSIISKKMFSSKSIKLHDIDEVTFSYGKGLIFRGNNSKISFGQFTIGLIEMLKFTEKNIPKHKCEKAIIEVKNMLRKNRINI